MNIEMASGRKVERVEEGDLLQGIDSLNDSNNFLILSGNSDYIQCAYSDGAFVAEYQDESGHYSSGDVLDNQKVKEVFAAYLAGNPVWKSMISWDMEEGASQGSAASNSPDGSGEKNVMDDLSAGNLLNMVKNQVKREVNREVSRRSSGLIRRIIRKFLG